MTIRVSAPGKVMISGEYVVLDGAEALVAAVDARVIGIAARGKQRQFVRPVPLPPEAEETRRIAEHELGPTGMALSVDAGALYREGRKLGLGSSAATSVVSAAGVIAWHGGDPARDRRRVLRLALTGHRAVAPQGSGADVAACALGGLVRFTSSAPEDAEVLEWPTAVHTVVVWSGRTARTSDLVGAVRALAADRPREYRAEITPLREAAEALAAAVLAGDASLTVSAADAHCAAMDRLGHAAGVAIVSPELRRLAALARDHGGAAKPSGAGGGDVALGFFADAADAQGFGVRCDEAGFVRLPLALGAEGVRVDSCSAADHELRERG